jgi:hypothetical protein
LKVSYLQDVRHAVRHKSKQSFKHEVKAWGCSIFLKSMRPGEHPGGSSCWVANPDSYNMLSYHACFCLFHKVLWESAHYSFVDYGVGACDSLGGVLFCLVVLLSFVFVSMLCSWCEA